MNRIERQIAAITAIADCKDERLVVVDSYGNDLEIGIYQLANDVKDTLEKLNAVYEAAKGLAYSRINGVTFPKLIELVEAAGEAMMLKTGADFDGQTYSHTLDHKRLTGQLKRVYDVMSDGNWHRLPEIAHRAQGSEASCSARIRDLRKDKFGGFEVERRRHETQKGVFLYRLIVGQEELF